MARKTLNNVEINVEFEEASSRQSLDSGEKVNTLFGKIKKWFSDLKAVAFSGSWKDLSDKPTFLTGGSQTSTSTADGGNNVYTFTTSDGKTSTFTVKNGAKGSKGDKGDQGLQGLQGVPGEKGEKGDQGLQGTAGKNGTNGTTPHIDETTGNWFIGTTDTKVHAQGPQGVQGKQGATGATGPQGPQGLQGATGATGAKGDKGDTGAAGKGISSTNITYQVSSSGTVAPTNTWSSTVPSTSAGQFLWTKIVITYTDKSTATFYSVSRNGSNGAAGAKGDKGDTGVAGARGATGTRGSRWNVGTAITGTSTAATAYATGISDSLVNDMYLNSSTGLVYKCTVAGNATNAKWVYEGSIKGATGPQGPQGAAGAKGADGLTTKVAVGGTTFTHSNGTVTVSNEAVQKAVTPTAPVSGHVAVYDGTTGKLKDSGYPLATQVATNQGTIWGAIPFIQSNGVMEIGKFLDFHSATSEAKDYGFRFTWDGTELVATGGNIKGNLNGNAATATKAAQLTTARTINGVSFNGTANIAVPRVISTNITGKTIDLDTLNMSASGSAGQVEWYINTTSGGAANIANLAVAGQPFALRVTSIRWASTADYITEQRFLSVNKNEYQRWCTKGTWTAWVQLKFTDTNTTYTAATASKDGLMPSADKAKIDLITKPATTGYVIQKDSNGYYVEV